MAVRQAVLEAARDPARRAEGGYAFGLLSPEHHADVQAVRDAVIASLPDPDLYRREKDERDFVARHLAGGGITQGIWRGGRLVAFAALGFGEFETAKQPFELPRPYRGRLDQRRVLWSSSTMVLPSERGAGLQRWLIERRGPVAATLGRDVLLSAVTPANEVSWSNVLSAGFEIVAVVGADRPFFLLARDASCGGTSGDVRAHVPARDVSRHRIFAEAGWRGVRRAEIDGAPAVEWRPPSPSAVRQVGA